MNRGINTLRFAIVQSRQRVVIGESIEGANAL